MPQTRGSEQGAQEHVSDGALWYPPESCPPSPGKPCAVKSPTACTPAGARLPLLGRGCGPWLSGAQRRVQAERSPVTGSLTQGSDPTLGVSPHPSTLSAQWISDQRSWLQLLPLPQCPLDLPEVSASQSGCQTQVGVKGASGWNPRALYCFTPEPRSGTAHKGSKEEGQTPN